MSERHEKLETAAAAAKHRVDHVLGHIWWAILIRGLLAIALAVCAFVWPSKTLGLLVKLLGGYFTLDGILAAIAAYRGRDKTSTVIQTIVSLTLGITLLIWTDVSGRLFLILVGIWLLLQGVTLFISAFRLDRDDETRGFTFIVGGVMSLVGLVFVFWTGTGVTAISWLIGFGSLIIGALLVYLATRVRRIRKAVDKVGHNAS